MKLIDVDQLARRQLGVIHIDQTGWTRSAWYRAIRSGQLVQVHPGVARLVGTEPTERQRIRAGLLAVPGSVASHRSAALLWQLVDDDATATVHLSTPGRSARREELVGAVCHRPDDRRDLRAVARQGMLATPPLRTLLDLGITDPSLVPEAVGRALTDGLLTIAALDAGLERHAVQGRTGVRALRAAIDAWSIDARPADSVLEAAFARLCRRAHLPPVLHHQRIGRWEVDFRFAGTSVLVECDGWATHGRDRDQFERDRRKDDDLRAAGWVVARLTYRAISDHPVDTARRLRRLLDRWSTLPVPDAA